MAKAPKPFVAACSAILDRFWAEITALGEKGQLADWVSDEHLAVAIRDSVNSDTKTYRYVLPTQLVAKVADRSLDCRCLQARRGGRGAFDARTIAHRVIVEFDKQNDNVLGGAPEPYVSNPLRVPEITAAHRESQKDKAGWDALCEVLKTVEDTQKPPFTELVFRQVLTEVYRRLGEVRVTYPVPIRVSLKRSLELVEGFISEQSGGDRVLAVTCALFRVLGQRFGLFSDIRRGTINTADLAAGLLADLECVSASDEIVMVVEVKDRELTISQMQDKIPNLREKRVREIFFVAQKGIAAEDEARIEELLAKEFVGGQNIYVVALLPLCHVAFALLGEAGRQEVLRAVGVELDVYRSDIKHRRAWAGLLAGA